MQSQDFGHSGHVRFGIADFLVRLGAAQARPATLLLLNPVSWNAVATGAGIVAGTEGTYAGLSKRE